MFFTFIWRQLLLALSPVLVQGHSNLGIVRMHHTYTVYLIASYFNFNLSLLDFITYVYSQTGVVVVNMSKPKQNI